MNQIYWLTEAVLFKALVISLHVKIANQLKNNNQCQ